MKVAEKPPSARRSPDRVASFRHAFAGGWHVLRSQPNARIHALFSVGVVGVGLWLRLEMVEWAVIVVVMGMVWVAEFTNTALEAVADLASPELHPLAKIGKDVSAAAVLVSAGTSVIVGLLILGPPLFGRLWPYVLKLWK